MPSAPREMDLYLFGLGDHMTDLTLKRLLLGSSLLVSFAAAPAFAQTDDTDLDTISDADREVLEEVIDGDDGEIVVTGSRLKRSTFTSITPLEVIDTDFAAQQGLFNPVEILQSSSSAAGVQIDSTFQGFVLDNGPGSETVDLRGLGASRTLVVADGRRVAPSGVEGAPSQVSINTIPATFVDDFQLLLDGASSVYGSDAVAGVANIILKRDFDGLEVDFRGNLPEQSGGEAYTIGASYGINGDRGFIGVQGEYDFNNNFTTGDRDFLAGCDTYYEETEDGEIRTGNRYNNYLAGLVGISAPINDCIPQALTQRIIAGGFGSIYYQPDIANSNIGPFSESTLFGVPFDANNDGVRDVNFNDFSRNGQDQEIRDIIAQQELISGRVVAEYTFEGAANITPYVDVIYSDLQVDSQGGQPQLFPFVPANNPFNPCNIDAVGGTDCNAAYNAALTDPRYLELFRAYYTNPNPLAGGTDNCFGLGDTPACSPVSFGLLRAPGTSLQVRPVVGVAGDRSVTDVNIQNTRVVGGVRGDLPGLSFGEAGDFSWDVSMVYSISDSESARQGIRGDRLDLALGFNPLTGAVLDGGPCSAAGLPFDVAAGCVPVNLFAPSLYTSAIGDFATSAERDYLFDSRDFSTVYEQTTLDAFLTGTLFTLPGGDVQIGLGAQWREDDIDSQPDDIARDGLFFGFFSDAGASGDVTKKELYGEISLPLGLGVDGFREFTIEAAGRLTDDEFYGTNETYSLKGGWRPIDSLLIRGTYGTSFRAPTVRELFLAGQTGFNTLFDPCAAPDQAGPGGGTGDDDRDPAVLEQCRADGLDPLTFSPGAPFFSTEIRSGGVQAGEANLSLDPETSTSLTAGASFSQPFTDAFDLELGFTYYEYEIENTFSELTAGRIIAQCYDNEPGVNPACAFIQRDFADGATPGRFDLISESFINQDGETAKGLDLNLDFGMDDVNLFGKNADFFLVADVNRQHERLFLDSETDPDTGELIIDEEELAGEFGFAKWRGRGSAGVIVDKFGFTWTSQYIGGVKVDEEDLAVEGFSNFIDTQGDIVTAGGPEVGDVNARRVSSAGDYWRHSASLRYAHNENFAMLFGVNNVFDRSPPLVDGREVFAISNVAFGSGYDLNGRSFFARIDTRF